MTNYTHKKQFLKRFKDEFFDKREEWDISILSKINLSSVSNDTNLFSNEEKTVRQKLFKAIKSTQEVYIKDKKMIIKNPESLNIVSLEDKDFCLAIKELHLSYGTYYSIKVKNSSLDILLGYFPPSRKDYAYSLYNKYRQLVEKALLEIEVI